MKYFHTNEQGDKVEVALERWIWGVIYNDGTELMQFQSVENQEDGVFHQFKEIDWSNVKLFLMCKSENLKQHVAIIPEPQMQIFHFYQHNGDNMGGPKTLTYVFGWKDKETGKAVHYYILPDDRMIVTGERKDITQMI